VATTFQWRRCDAGGANCIDIAGQTSSSYGLTSADTGQSIRVVADAVTSNAWGVTLATPYFSDTEETTPWPAPPWNGTVVQSGFSTITRVADPIGQRGFVSKHHLTDSTDYADWAWLYLDPPPSGAVNGAEVWSRSSFLLPSTFTPVGNSGTGSNYNWMGQFHAYPTSSYAGGPKNMDDSGMISWGLVAASPGGVFQETFRCDIHAGNGAVLGGSTFTRLPSTTGFTGMQNPATKKTWRNVWIDYVERVKFSPTGTGIYQSWMRCVDQSVDWLLVCSGVNIPTLYQPYWDYPSNFVCSGIFYRGYYRGPAAGAVNTTWAEDYYTDDFRLGTTAGAIGFVVP
jgi:hypothetical protein